MAEMDPDPTTELTWLHTLPAAARLTGLSAAEIEAAAAAGRLPSCRGSDGVLRVRIDPRPFELVIPVQRPD